MDVRMAVNVVVSVSMSLHAAQTVALGNYYYRPGVHVHVHTVDGEATQLADAVCSFPQAPMERHM